MIETEAKVLLTYDQFNQLKRHFHIEDGTYLYQQNTYYDTVNETLKALQSAFRLRNFATSSEWTIKQSLNQYDALEINQVNDHPIQPPKVLDIQWIHNPHIRHFFEEHHINPEHLQLTYQIETLRYWITTPYGKIALDESHYAGTTDYELEFEMIDLSKGLSFFEQLLNQFHIPNHPAPKKIARVAKAMT